MKNQTDILIKEFLEKKVESQHLGIDFNERLMARISNKNTAKVYSFSPGSVWMMVALLGLLFLCAVVYILVSNNINLGIPLNLDGINDGLIKYSLYSLTALLFFTILDKFLQLKENVKRIS